MQYACKYLLRFRTEHALVYRIRIQQLSTTARRLRGLLHLLHDAYQMLDPPWGAVQAILISIGDNDDEVEATAIEQQPMTGHLK